MSIKVIILKLLGIKNDLKFAKDYKNLLCILRIKIVWVKFLELIVYFGIISNSWDRGWTKKKEKDWHPWSMPYDFLGE